MRPHYEKYTNSCSFFYLKKQKSGFIKISKDRLIAHSHMGAYGESEARLKRKY